jgi:hypothetical protein
MSKRIVINHAATDAAEDVTGYVFYRGPSQLDGKPVVGIILIGESSNSKTGKLIQTYILRADIHPVLASQTGQDESICGIGDHACKWRGTYKDGLRVEASRGCYVQLQNAPSSIFGKLLANGYPEIDPAVLALMLTDRKVRLGAYGDPAAIPFAVWLALLQFVAGVTGYTHQWRLFHEFRRWCMASVDSESDREAAHALGYRTFRVGPTLGWTKLKREALCPASKEAGRKLTCIDCMACGGESAPNTGDIVIPDHGPKRARPRRIATR